MYGWVPYSQQWEFCLLYFKTGRLNNLCWNQTERVDHLSMIPFTLTSKNRQILKKRKSSLFARGQGSEWRLGRESSFTRFKAFLWEDKKVSKQSYREMRASQHVEYINALEWCPSKWLIACYGNYTWIKKLLKNPHRSNFSHCRLTTIWACHIHM